MAESASHSVLKVPQGEFVLERVPKCPPGLLRAWDAADEYLLEYLSEHAVLVKGLCLVIVNDSFGGLAIPLHDFQPQVLSDSYLSHIATRQNLKNNNLPEATVKLKDSLSHCVGQIDVLLIKVPKTMALLEDELQRLRPSLTEKTQIIVAGMIKAMPPSVWKLLERLIGPTSTALAKKKSRLIFAKLDGALKIPKNPYPIEYQLENTPFLIINHANVFSRDSLDIGTRFFIQHLPASAEALDIVDLGCGNGIVGLVSAGKNPHATLCFIDESYMAIVSAETNFYRAYGKLRRAEFCVADSLSTRPAQSADRIFCNPPFHQQHAIGDQIAMRMFKGAYKVLRKNGQLWVIGNRHLGYHLALKRVFGNVTLVATNEKFVILKSTRG